MTKKLNKTSSQNNIISWKALDKLLWVGTGFKDKKKEEREYKDFFASKVSNTLKK